MSCFRVYGKTASLNESLHIFAGVGASKGSKRFNSHVGTGSSEQCLAGALLTILVISSGVTTSKADILIQGRSVITSAGAPAVAWRNMSERNNLSGSVKLFHQSMSHLSLPGVIIVNVPSTHELVHNCTG